MDFKPHLSFPLKDRSFQNVVKREITRLAASFDFSPGEVGKIDIIVSEMASNLFKHGAVDGELLVKPLGPAVDGLEILCLDKGPGMLDLRRMMEDGVSTAGTQGEGLGAIKRLSDEFDIFSQPGVGTMVLSRLYKSQQKPSPSERNYFDIGVVMVPKTGEKHCGDGWAMRQGLEKCHLLATDGLGHGEFAHLASQQAQAAFLDNANQDPAALIRQMHLAIKKTRGAVGNVATIDLSNQTLTYCGVGNIAGRVIIGPDTTKSVISYNGIIGHNIPSTLHNHQVEWRSNSLLILHSDGIKSKWDLSRFKDLTRHDTSLIAALIYKEFVRGTDDSLVMVARARNL